MQKKLKIKDAKDYLIATVLRNNHIFKIPHYQRRYSWDYDQWNDFWNDLITLEEGEEHFLGTILLITESDVTGAYTAKEVVDGQQRLMTISLLLCVIKNYLISQGKSDFAKELANYYLYSKKPGMEQVQKLQPISSEKQIDELLA